MLFKKTSIAVLGSTGSIGVTTLKIIDKYPKYFRVELLSCNKNKKIILKQIKKYLPKYVIVSDKKVFNLLTKIKFKKKILIFNNLADLKKIKKIKFDKVILAISSVEGLQFAFSFVHYTNNMFVANKETFVCGGKLFLKLAMKLNCKIKSLDSEHYCINFILEKFKISDIDKIYLTSSGGPFLHHKKNDIKKIDIKHALNHPKWRMGKKISIDSATMANKGLEVIEASILFNLDPTKIKIKIHEQANVHSCIILKNGLVFLIAHNTSMQIPIENSLLGKKKINENYDNFFCKKNFFSFTFDEKKLNKFKMVSLAYKVLNYGPRACIFYNVINDYLVNLYLNKKIFFYEIEHKLNKVLNNKKLKLYFKNNIKNFDDINKTIYFAKYIASKI